MKNIFNVVILNLDVIKILLAHPYSWSLLVGFFLLTVHNILVLNRKVNIDKEREISKQFNAISRLYPEGTFIPHK